MAPNREPLLTGSSANDNMISMQGLQRTISDISFEISKAPVDSKPLAIPEVEDARCECCDLSEECTPEYINSVRDKFSGKLICGLCAEAVKEETEKNGGDREEALNGHISACSKFNRVGRRYPVLYQAEAIKEILKKSSRRSPKCMDHKGGQKKGGITRSSSCISAITRDIGDSTMVN